jgi:hypothetical protein
MGNIKNFNFNKIDVRVSNSDYYDFFLAEDESCLTQFSGIVSGSSLVVTYDFNNSNIFSSGATSADTIYSLTTWTGATNTGYTISTVGLTGIDNGLVGFTKVSGDSANTALLSALTGTTLVIPSGETRLCLNRVTGFTGNYEYPMSIITDTGTTGNYARFCGGFYQGYYKLDGNSYEVLPTRPDNGFTAEFWLRKGDNCVTGSTILNDTYTGNTGFFFYMGTRAENKFWNQFEGLNTGSTSGCTSGATEWCTIPKETDIILTDSTTGSGFTLSPPQTIFTEIDNQFLIYSRAKGGKVASTFTGTSIYVASTPQVVTDDRNPFLIYHRGSGGKVACGNCGSCGGCTSTGSTGQVAGQYSGTTQDQTELDKKLDIYDNALGFRIKDDGSIGYRLLTYTGSCSGDTTVTGVTVEEAYSASGMVSNDIWTHVAIRFVPSGTLESCTQAARTGKLMFYVNGKLKYVVDEFDEFIARRLIEHQDKQVAVPFNISLGGGSQGLLEHFTFDGQDPDDLGCLIEQNFAGTFIGDISTFRMYIDNLNYCELNNNYSQEKAKYGH